MPEPRPGHTLPDHTRSILVNDKLGEHHDDLGMIVVAHLGEDIDCWEERRDIAYLHLSEGWTWPQLKRLAQEIAAVPELLEALAMCHAQITSLLGAGGPPMDPLSRATMEHCLVAASRALDSVHREEPVPS